MEKLTGGNEPKPIEEWSLNQLVDLALHLGKLPDGMHAELLNNVMEELERRNGIQY